MKRFTQLREIPDGEQGLQAIVDFLNLVAVHYGQSPILRQAAKEVCDGLNDDDRLGQINRLTEFVKRSVKYINDPLLVEDVTSPVQLLDDISRKGNAQGDCDDHCVLLASLLQSVGFMAVIAAVKLDAPEWNHVVVLVDVDGQIYSLDACAKNLAPPEYREHLMPS